MSGVFLGVDIGSVALKAVVIAPPHVQGPPDLPAPPAYGGWRCWVIPAVRTLGRPVDAAMGVVQRVQEWWGQALGGVRFTGSAAQEAASILGVTHENEFLALARGVALVVPEARTILEMGGETSKYLRVRTTPSGVELWDYETNGDCAAGTGSFIDQQALRLGCAVEDIGGMVQRAARMARIAGRCSVFAKSDMIHAQQRGFTPEEVLAGLCEAVARNFKASVVKGREVEKPVVMVGGVAANEAVVRALDRLLGLGGSLQVPPHHAHLAALGAAVMEAEAARHERPRIRPGEARSWATMPPLSLERVTLLRERAPAVTLPARGEHRTAYLGIDVGSVSTNFAVVDERGDVLWELYVRTRARPLEVVRDGLRRMAEELGDRVSIAGVGTTGSGRELIGALVGADVVKDEITAHKVGASFIAARYLGTSVDTILEVGGQDSKYIRLQDGVVVDFALNEACAAGTGSFLEEQAAQLGVQIDKEFARLALSSRAPVRLGERCTVFMERDVFACLRAGVPIEDVAAGLAYSVAQNYVNRVARGRPIDGVVFFQGGTAYNDAVAAAFSQVVGCPIIVPPHNGVMGAIGVALLAREWARTTGLPTSFRGTNPDRVRYSLREFVCHACTNQCTIQEFTVGGHKSYWGDQCSQRFRAPQRAPHPPLVDDLYKFYLDSLPSDCRGQGVVVGVPRALHMVELLPFWHAFFSELGWTMVTSPWTTRAMADLGVELAVAEPCFPVKLAHAHLAWLVERDVDVVFLPTVINRPTPQTHTESFVCVWCQTAPLVARAARGLVGLEARLLAPPLWMRAPHRAVHELSRVFARFGVSARRVRKAFAAGGEAQDRFVAELRSKGAAALRTLERMNRQGIVVVGRPYTIYDRLVCLDVPSKLRSAYGVDVIPIDFLEVDSVDIRSVAPRMYWNSGRRIVAAASLCADRDLSIVYISCFKCGPDSFIKHYVYPACRKPFLTLTFDGHANDAGILTRVEAFLESKGMLALGNRPWGVQVDAA